MKKLLILLTLITSVVVAQDKNESTNSFFDDSETKEFSLNKLFVGGEVAEPGDVDLSLLPLHGCPAKVVEMKNNDKSKFKGAYFFTGYALHDIISSKKVMKANEEEFSPFVDLYVIVENDKGDKAVFSWGELFYSKDNFKIIITKTATGINPSKMTMKWPLPEDPSIICANDFSNVRFISNPTRITVKSVVDEYAKERRDDIFSPEIKIITDDQTVSIADIGEAFSKRKVSHLGYGHGRGYKGITDYEGFLLKDVLNSKLNLPAEFLNRGIVVISAKDGYRVAYSITEILNRNDMDDFLLVDFGDSESRGRYTLLSIPDFFVDRNVRSVEKIELKLVN